MPTRQRSTKKRVTRKRGKRPARARKSRVSRSFGSGMPSKMFLKLKYSELYALAYGGAGIVSNNQWNLTSLFKPNYTSAGHQPYLFDQYKLLYNRYRVYGVKWSVSFISSDTAQQYDCFVLIRPDTVFNTNAETTLESTNCKRTILGIESGGNNVKTLSGYVSCAQACALSKREYNASPNTAALISASPSLVPILNTMVSNQNTGAAGSVNIRINLIYFCSLYDRIQLSQS